MSESLVGTKRSFGSSSTIRISTQHGQQEIKDDSHSSKRMKIVENMNTINQERTITQKVNDLLASSKNEFGSSQADKNVYQKLSEEVNEKR